MKIGILTFCNSQSYGAALQMYALYRTLEGMGHDVELIHYQNPWMKKALHTAQMQNSSAMSRRIKRCAKRLIHHRLFRVFRRFERKMVCFPSSLVTDRRKLSDIAKRYDAVVCGSDQVWNPDITGSDLSYFFDFCGSGTRRISYAPSFGVEKLPDRFAQAAAEELRRFAAVSVREEEGCALVGEMLGSTPTLVLDPTFLRDRAQWEAEEEPCSTQGEDYILYYPVRSNGCLWSYCEKLAEETGLKILKIGGGPKDRSTEKVRYMKDVGPAELLYLIHHAKYIGTNSFHGMALAINYRKNFFVELSSTTNSRMAQLVRSFGLEGRVIRDARTVLPLETDYSVTNERLPEWKERSLQFLREALT